MVIQLVSHFKGSAKRWVVVIVLVRGAGVAARATVEGSILPNCQ
jgi:hypothetical protein